MSDTADRSIGRIGVSAIWIFVGMAGLAAALTGLFLGMRSVMQIGGTCASGNPPFVISHPCPKGIPLVMLGSIWGGLLFAGIYTWASIKAGAPNLVLLAWPALFLSLGYNFFDYGIHPPVGDGLVWGWLICGILFAIMGGGPLVLGLFTLRAKGDRGTPGRMVTPLMRARAGLVGSAGWRGAGTTSQAAAGSGSEDLVSSLERLAEMRQQGQLTEQEYQAAKAAVLSKERRF